MSSPSVVKDPSNSAMQSSSNDQTSTIESKETSASASASAGLNLNVFGALSGVFSSKSKKDTAPDGDSTETKDEQAHVKGAGAGNPNAQGAASAEEKGREMRAAIKEDGA